MASILFLYPPTADPTGPYLSIPYLVAAVRAHGHTAGVLDLNILGYRSLLRRSTLERVTEECRDRVQRLPQDGLRFQHAAEYLALQLALADAERVVHSIDDAVVGLRDPQQFYDRSRYHEIVRTLDGALNLLSARHHPLELAFTTMRTPFHLNDADEIAREGHANANPFFASYLEHLIPRLERERPDVVGISATFNAQLLQAFTLGRLVKERFPDIHVTMGGTAPTQLALRSDAEVLRSLAPFVDSIVLFEGERTINDLLDRVAAGGAAVDVKNVLVVSDPTRHVREPTNESLDAWPTPDYSDMPLDLYFAPEPMLYLAPTRGCYWEKCAFCHYGLTDAGTAPYRRRSVDRFVDDLRAMQSRHGARMFYFAGDLIDPRYLQQLAERIVETGLQVRYTSDLRIERSFTPERCEKLARSGLVAAAFGTESDAPRMLKLIDKGTDPKANRTVFENFSNAGVAVQAMTFIDFPTETAAEANLTLDLLEHNQDRIDLFFVEEFDLEVGSRVFRFPDEYGVREIYFPAGDRLKLRARFQMKDEAKNADEYRRLKRRMDTLASAYGRRSYPYAGSVSVAHTMLWFDRFGREVFKRVAEELRPRRAAKLDPFRVLDAYPRPTPGLSIGDLPYDLEQLAAHVGEHTAELTNRLENELRDVRRSTWEAQAAAIPMVRPTESYYLFPQDSGPVPVPQWVWMLVSCFDGTASVREAARHIKVTPKDAARAVAALAERGYLIVDATEARATANARA
ncbi:MAG: cobalamin-dependent protein [Planctomycetes bacterium]|nr:cobalamin-dependent protein [Planctomycetota bacterium]